MKNNILIHVKSSLLLLVLLFTVSCGENPSSSSVIKGGNGGVDEATPDNTDTGSGLATFNTLLHFAGKTSPRVTQYVAGIGLAATLPEITHSPICTASSIYLASDSAVYSIDYPAMEIELLAGDPEESGNVDGAGVSALFDNIEHMTSDGTFLYVYANGVIKKIDISTKVVTTIAGQYNSKSTLDGVGTAARIAGVGQMVYDSVTNSIFFSSPNSNTIRKLDLTTLALTTYAGSGVSGNLDGVGTAARFSYPSGLIIIGRDLYVGSNTSLRKIDLNNATVTNFTTAAGYYFSYLSSDGSKIFFPSVYGSVLSSIDLTTKAIATVAGVGAPGDQDGIGIYASLGFLKGACAQGSFLYVADSTSRALKQIDLSTNTVTRVLGNPSAYSSYQSSEREGSGSAIHFWSASMGEISSIDGSTLYMPDRGLHTIRKFDLNTNTISTIAGRMTLTGNTNGTGAAARFNRPQAVLQVGSDLYIGDALNNSVRKMNLTTGAVTNFASVNGVEALQTDGTYIYAASYYSIYRILLADATVELFAGNLTTSGYDDGIGAAARFSSISGMLKIGTELYVTDSCRVRVVDLGTKEVSTLLGDSSDCSTVDGVGAAARFNYTSSITASPTHLFVSTSDSIRSINLTTLGVSTLAKYGNTWNNVWSTTMERIRLSSAVSAIFYTNGNLIFSDGNSKRIWKLNLTTQIATTIAGMNSNPDGGWADGSAANARFNDISGMISDGTYLYVSEIGNQDIRKVRMSDGTTTTLAGSGYSDSADGIGAAASFDEISGMVLIGDWIYLTEEYGHVVKKVHRQTGETITLAGSLKQEGEVDGVGSNARLYWPAGVATDGTFLYFGDAGNCTIRKMSLATNEVTTIAGSSADCSVVDGTGTGAGFSWIEALVLKGRILYIADDEVIRKMNLDTLEVETIAGSPDVYGEADGIGSNAEFWTFYSMTSDDENLYIIDSGNLRKLNLATNEVTTLKREGNKVGSGSFSATGVGMRFMKGVVFTSDGLFVSSETDISKID